MLESIKRLAEAEAKKLERQQVSEERERIAEERKATKETLDSNGRSNIVRLLYHHGKPNVRRLMQLGLLLSKLLERSRRSHHTHHDQSDLLKPKIHGYGICPYFCHVMEM